METREARKNGFTIRRLRPGDEGVACALAAAFKSAARTPEQMAAFLDDERCVLFTAFVEETVAGFLLAYELPRVDRPRPMLLIYEIEVHAAHRRQGIGSALVAAANALCRTRGFNKMWVLAEKNNEAALRLYASTGGERVVPDNVLFCYRYDPLEEASACEKPST